MNKLNIVFGVGIIAGLYACSDSSTSSVQEVCDYDSNSGYYFCKDADGNYSYAILPDGSTQEIPTPISPDSLGADSTSADLCTDALPVFSLNGIHYYSENESTFYYDENCNPVYLVESDIPLSSSNEILVTSSSSEQGLSSEQTTISSSSAAVIFNPNGNERTITFSNSGVEINDTNCVEIYESTAKILCAGDYYLSGESSNFQVMVMAADTDKVYLYFNNLNLKSSDAPIYVQNADKVFLMLIDGTNNFLADASSRSATYTKADGSQDTTIACIYAKDDLTIKGNGSLEVKGNYNNGIHCSNDIKIKDSPNLVVTAKNHGIKGKGSVEIEGGKFTINTTEGDAIKSDEGESEGYNAEKGYVQITGGKFTIIAGDDGIQAYNYVFIADSNSTPTLEIKTGNGASTNSNSNSQFGGSFGNSSTTTDTTSLKGIKADSLILINAGNINLNSADDAIHSNGTIRINGGNITIAATDDAIHADVLFNLNDGKIQVTTCYEGFEAYELQISGGETSVSASDDAWNAAGGSDNNSSNDSFRPGGNSTSSGIINLSGGYHHVKTGSGDTDGIDSNGDINITGGVLVIEAGGNIIDKGDNGNVNYTSGILLGMGKQNEGVPSNGNPTCFSNLSANTRFSVVKNSSVLSTFIPSQTYSTGIYVNSNSGSFYTGGNYSGGTETFFGYGENGSISNATQINSSTCSTSGMGGR